MDVTDRPARHEDAHPPRTRIALPSTTHVTFEPDEPSIDEREQRAHRLMSGSERMGFSGGETLLHKQPPLWDMHKYPNVARGLWRFTCHMWQPERQSLAHSAPQLRGSC